MTTKNKIVSIQGVKGAFHEIAAREYFGDEEISIKECKTFNEVVTTVLCGHADYGIMAIENSIAGSILPNYKIIRESKVRIIGEIFIPIHQHLMALQGQRLKDISEVYSHPMAIQQCEDFFNQHTDIKVIESIDTAISARNIKENSTKGCGAIASKLAASIYGLEIIAENIETSKRNYTRFLIIEASTGNETDENSSNIDKSSFCFSLAHESGSLYKVLSVLAFYNLNLTKIQSLPILGKEWEYFFYIDVVFDSYLRYKQALSAISPLSIDIEILGEYKSYEKQEESCIMQEVIHEN